MSGRAEGRCVLACVTGCIAAYKACELVRMLQKQGARVKVLMSEHATQFIGPTTFRALTHEKLPSGSLMTLLTPSTMSRSPKRLIASS